MIKIHALQTGTVAIKENQRRGQGRGLMRAVNVLAGRQWTPYLPIHAWLIEHPEGLILVDTGETARVAKPGYFPRWHPFFQTTNRMNVQPDDEVGPELRRAGFAPDDVRQVVLTHLHTDHAGGLHHFPKAEILVTRQEFAATRGFQGKINGYLPHRMPDWLQPRLLDFEAKPYENFPQSFPLTRAGDVMAVATPGHSVGHLSVIVRQDDLSYFLAGDTSYTETFMLEQAVNSVSPDETIARQTLNHILTYTRQHPTVYLPAHDPNSALRLKTRQVTPA